MSVTADRGAIVDLKRETRRGLELTHPYIVRIIRDQELVAAKDVEREETVAVVVAMEEPALLLPVHWRVGRIKIQDQLRRPLPVRSNKLFDLWVDI
jgi:hypothetical protein